MASQQGARIGNKYPAVHNITVNQITLNTQDIGKWRDAINAARNRTNPKRRLLYELYDNIIIDGHLLSVMQKRRLSVQNKNILFMIDGNEGTVDDAIRNNLLETPWFNKLIGYISDGVAPYGNSLIELIPEAGVITDVELINRANVYPERDFMAWHYANDSAGIYYKTDPAYVNNMLSVGGKKDYGLLMTAAQYVIYKRGGFGDWARFAELFGIPFRTAYYNPFDDQSRKTLETALASAGAAPYLVLPDGSRMEIKDNNNAGKSEVFDMMIERCNTEISKIFLGQTTTTDQSGNRAQTITHKEIEDEIILADMKAIEYILNFDLKPKLTAWGFNLDKGRFQFPEVGQLSVEKRLEMDIKLSEKIEISDEYWYETYGVPKPDGIKAGAPVKTKPEPNKNDPKKPDPNKPEPKKNTPNNQHTTEDCGCETCVEMAAGKESDFESAFNDTVLNVFNSKEISFDLKLFNQLTDFYFDAFTRGWKKDSSNDPTSSTGIERMVNPEYNSPDFEMINFMEQNIFEFACAESIDIVQKLNDLLPDAQTFEDFKAAVMESGIYVEHLNHLKTNYNLAYNTAYTSADYHRMVNNKDTYPSWQYLTAGDSRVRNAHKQLDGKIFPADDEVWNTIYPPNGFNCRCYVKPLFYKPKEYSTKQEALEILESNSDDNGISELDKMKKGGFNSNRSKTGSVFQMAENLFTKYKTTLNSNGMYGTKEMNFNNLDKTNLPKLDSKIKNAKAAENWWLQNKNSENKIPFTDHLHRNIELNEETFKGIINSKSNYGLIDSIKDLLQAPDEVWLNNSGKDSFTYSYIKFYADKNVCVKVEIKNGKPINIISANEATNDIYRKGILVKRYK